MPLTNGQKTALYLLLTSRSEFRLMLEGRYLMNAGVPAAAESAPPQAPPDAVTLTGRFLSLAKSRFGLAPADFNTPLLAHLFAAGSTDPAGAATNVTSNSLAIRSALDMLGPYPQNEPCPDIGHAALIFNAITNAVP